MLTSSVFLNDSEFSMRTSAAGELGKDEDAEVASWSELAGAEAAE